MTIIRRVALFIEGLKSGEAAPPGEAPPGRPPAGGGGRTPYAAYDVMAADKWAHDWDEKTRYVVLDRIRHVPERRFFSESEFALLEAICGRLVPQDDRAPEHTIPLAPYIDARLENGEGDGYRFEEMPWDPEGYRLGLAGVVETSRSMFGGATFTELNGSQQDAVLGAIEKGDPPREAWRHLPAKRFFQLLVQDVVSAYYAHPTAWNEIGFQGPASPRGHIRLSLGKRDPWEADERQPLSAEDRARPSDERRPAASAHSGATH